MRADTSLGEFLPRLNAILSARQEIEAMAHRFLGRTSPVAIALAAIALCGSVSFPAFGQAPATKEEKKEIPKPEDISLDTTDGVVLKCTYYGSLKEKLAVPVILVHGWGGSRKEYDKLALGLQAAGHAVIVPDLRGHGGSIARKVPGLQAAQPINFAKMKPAEYGLAAQYDLEAVKQFLMSENNAGKLNIEMLCVVGAEYGAITAVNWAVQDWSWPQLPNMKQGQDVKALVLISPESQFKTLKMQQLNQFPQVAQLSMLLIAGKKDNNKAAQEVQRLEKLLERFHYKYVFDAKDDDKTKAEKAKKRDLFTYLPDTILQGTKLLTDDSLRLLPAIATFIDLRLVQRADSYPWAER